MFLEELGPKAGLGRRHLFSFFIVEGWMTHSGSGGQAGGQFGCTLEPSPAWPWETDSVVMGGFLEEKGCFLRADTNLEMRRELLREDGSPD